jgi:hypothetical protein
MTHCSFGCEHYGTSITSSPFQTVMADVCVDAVVASVGGNAFSTSGNSDSGFGSLDDRQCADTFLDWGASPDAWFVWTAPATAWST